MSIDEIIKKATIKFPWDLTLKQSYGLMKYIAIKLHADVSYRGSQSMSVGYPLGYDELVENPGTPEVSGEINFKRKPIAFDFFKLIPSENDISKLGTIQFQLMSRSEPSDYKPQILHLWDHVRKAVDDYFEDNKE